MNVNSSNDRAVNVENTFSSTLVEEGCIAFLNLCPVSKRLFVSPWVAELQMVSDILTTALNPANHNYKA